MSEYRPAYLAGAAKKQNEINRNWVETTFWAAAGTIRVMFHTVFERTAS